MSFASRRLNLTLGLLGLVLLTSPLLYALYHSLYQRGLQAEARLLLSYAQTLQRAYRLETGSYAAFEWYGAPYEGQDACSQPWGAAQLGFVIHGCHQEEATPPRYAYRSVVSTGPSGSSYKLEAISGTDEQQRSLVCFTPDQQERWETHEHQAILPVETCW